PPGAFWDGKLEMVNAPLDRIREECLLWQVDSDELWTTEQFLTARDLFRTHPDKTAALYFCHYFVGEQLVITTRDTYGNHRGYEWIRTWRFTPGCRWTAHEPPRLCRPSGQERLDDLAGVNPFHHGEKETAGLIFQHFAYATAEQLKFKEAYYGYADALRQWRRLQRQTRLPLALKQHFAWVTDDALVDTAQSQGIVPLATRDDSGAWQFTASRPASEPKRILFVRTDAIGDAVLAASMLPLLHRKYPAAKLAVLCRALVSELYLACPFVDRVICFDWQKVQGDAAARREIVREIAEFQPELILNSIYSREVVTEALILAQQAPQVIGLEGNLSNISAQDRADCDRFYSRLLSSPGEHKPELERHRDFLAGLGVAADRLEPQVWTAPADEALADAFFKEQRLESATTIALFPGAQHDWKVYPRFAEVLRSLTGFRFLIFGGPEVAGPADQLAAEVPGPCLNLAGKTTLREMAALFRKCRLYVGTDSAGAHVACAVGLPNVVVLGGGHFGRFLPYSPLTSVACLPLECYGCNWACKFSTVHCVKDLDPAVVAEAIRQTLAGPVARPRVFMQGSTLWQPDAHSPRWKSAERFLAAVGAEILFVQPEHSPAAQDAPADSQAAVPLHEPENARVGNERLRQNRFMGPRRVQILEVEAFHEPPGEGEAPAEPTLEHLEKISLPLAVTAGPAGSVSRPAVAQPLISVIVSAYAAEKYIRACLEDLEAQTIAERLEMIVIDSGSPENERAIVGEFQKRYSNITYHRTERETLYGAWNRAIGLARGRYVANANCDDAHRPDALEQLLAALEAHPEADLAYGDYDTSSVPNDTFNRPAILRHVVHPPYHPATVMMYCVTGCHPMWRKTVFDKIGLFDPTYTAPGDYEFLLRFVQAGLRAVHVPQPLSLFFQNPEGLSWKSAAQTKNENERLLGKYRSEMPIGRLFQVDLSEASSVSRAWVALGNLA
ncbi:MAG TPA: glycosyltransferase, partial [Candidatus Binatia bacterium]|nr:glycosyltransferase [Candidatus Binatia bacterium]